jgi:transposase
VLSEFRSRLVEGGKERLLLEKMLEGCKERGYLKVRGRQHTDSTHVLGALRLMSKWERTAETMRSALNALASANAQWLTEHADLEWFERYGRRIEDQRLPKGKEAREECLKRVGADGIRLLARIDDARTPRSLKELAEVEILRRIRQQHYEQINGEIRVLDPKEMPEGARRIESPYEVEVRYSTKRSMGWVGYKVHLTESCDKRFP